MTIERDTRRKLHPINGQWFNNLPEGWSAAPLKRGYEVQLGKMLRTEPSSERDTLEPYLRAANVQWSGVSAEDINVMWFSPDEKVTYRLERGDLVVSEGGDVGRSAIWDAPIPDCYIQNAVHRVRANPSAYTKFLYHVLYAIKQSGHFDVICSKATIAHLTQEKLQEVPVPLPPLPEQQAIAAFLDRETACLDALTARKERLLGLLEEKRKAIISRAVTRGLDASVPLKDSGVEWLGQVPEGWVPYKVARAFSFIGGGTTPPSGMVKYYDGETPWVNTGDLTDGEIHEVSRSVTQKALDDFGVLRVYPPRTLLIALYGATIGKLGIINMNACTNQACCAFGSGGSLDVKFAFYWFFAAREHIIQLAYGGGQPNISQQTLKELIIPAPSGAEQQAIAAHLDVQTAKLDALRLKLELSVEKLREYRTALISAAVTGKIDVRGTVAGGNSQPNEVFT
jgi:type I restriction enzyme, S subunit